MARKSSTDKTRKFKEVTEKDGEQHLEQTGTTMGPTPRDTTEDAVDTTEDAVESTGLDTPDMDEGPLNETTP